MHGSSPLRAGSGHLTYSQRGHLMGCTVGEIGAFLFCCVFPFSSSPSVFLMPVEHCLWFLISYILDVFPRPFIILPEQKGPSLKVVLNLNGLKETSSGEVFRCPCSDAAAICHLVLCSKVFSSFMERRPVCEMRREVRRLELESASACEKPVYFFLYQRNKCWSLEYQSRV